MKHLHTSHKRFFREIILAVFTGLTLLFTGCGENTEVKITSHRTILVYMLSDNNLGESFHFDTQNIDDMLLAANDYGLKGGNLIIYRDGYNGGPQLIKIDSRKGREAKKIVVKEYPNRNSATTEVLREVINETVNLYPADEYGLILWSHSTGWVPKNSSIATAPPRSKGLPPTRSFGLDDKSYLELDELANAIPDGQFQFILSDACFTAGIEYAYQLRDKTRYLIGSAAEVMGAGMPYSKTIPLLFEKDLNLTAVCQSIYVHYNTQNGAYRTATVSLVDCQELENLAQTTAPILDNHRENFIPSSTSNIQHFDRSLPIICFDLEDYISTFANDSEMNTFNDALQSAVIYQAATPYILNQVPIHNHCGLTTYIWGTAKDEQAEEYYKTLNWYRDAYPSEQ